MQGNLIELRGRVRPDGSPVRRTNLFAADEESRNYATDPGVRDRARAVLEELYGAGVPTHQTLQTYREKFALFYNLYNFVSAAFFKDRYPAHVPLPHQVVETFHPRIMDAIFGSGQWFRPRGESYEADKISKIVYMLLNAQHRDMDLEGVFGPFVRDQCIYGTAIFYLKWDRRLRRVRSPKVVDRYLSGGEETVVLSGEYEEAVAFDGPRIKQVNIHDYICHPYFTDPQEAPFVGHRWRVGFQELVSQVRSGYYHFDDFQEFVESSPGWPNVVSLGAVGSSVVWEDSGLLAELSSDRTGQRPYVVQEYWGPFEIEEGELPVECVITMIDGREVVRIEENPYWHGMRPFLVGRHIKLSDEHFGKGMIEPIVGISMEMDDLRASAMESAHFSTAPMLIYSGQSGLGRGTIKLSPGQGVCLDDPNSAKFAPYPDMGTAARLWEQELKGDAYSVTGATPMLTGVSDTGRRTTATDVSTKQQNANMRLWEPIRNIVSDVLSPMLYMQTRLNWQFFRKERAVRRFGVEAARRYPEFSTIRPEDVVGHDCSFDILVANEVSQIGVRTQQMINLAQIVPPLVQIPKELWQQFGINPARLVKSIAKAGFYMQDIDDVFAEDPGDEVISADEERALLLAGHPLRVHDSDNHPQHLAAHMELYRVLESAMRMQRDGMELESMPKVDEWTLATLEAHIRNHALHLQRMTEMMQTAAHPPGGPMQGPPGGPVQGGPTAERRADGPGGPPPPPPAGQPPTGRPAAGPVGPIKDAAEGMAPNRPQERR